MYSIVADSCCDMTPELRKQLGLVSIPLTLTLGEDAYTDDESLDLPAFMQAMKSCKERIGSAAPAPDLYREAFAQHSPAFGLTLSSRLSASYQSAEVGRQLAEEEGAEAHVFDSKSASAGEVLVALELRRQIDQGKEKSAIIEHIEQFIAQMKTYFVLDSVDNLQKNGRMNFVVGKIISILGLKPILGSDGDGNISLFSQVRGADKLLQGMADTIAKSGRDTKNREMVITHCNNLPMAQKLRDIIAGRYQFSKIWLVPTGGLSSMYANDKGLMMAF